MSVRTPAVAGLFYPADPDTLRSQVHGFLKTPSGAAAGVPRALIAPHAGYPYSGPVAGTGYACIAGAADAYQRVLLLGPSHRVAFRGVALSSAAEFDTPLGPVKVDAALARRVSRLAEVEVLDEAHALEHSLEVHLPFIQVALPGRPVLPLVVGDAGPGQVEAVIATAADDPETLIIVSTDLSHFLSYEAARAADAETSEWIETLSPSLRPEQACGCRPVNGLLQFAAGHGLGVRTLDVRNSGDTAGSRDRVVGYGTYLLS